MAGIQIGIASETKAFKQGIETGVITPLEDAVGALDDLGKSKGTDKLEDGFEDAQKASKKLEKEVKDTADTIEKDFKNSYREMKQASESSTDSAKRDLGEMKREANSTAKESAASFDGSAESVVDSFQEIAANAFQGFGPVGAVAGLAAAAGIGLAVAGFEATAEAQAASEESIAGWADKYIEAGERIISASQVVAGVVAIATDAEQYKEASENAKNWGVDVTTAMRAMSGDSTAMTVTQETLNARTAEYKKILEDNATGAATSYGKFGPLTQAQEDLIAEVSNGIPAWNNLTKEMGAGAERADTVSEALKGVVDDAASAGVQVDKFGNKLYTLPDETQIVIDAKTGKATQNLDTFKGDLDKIPPTKAVVVNGTVQMDTRQLDAALRKSYTIDITGVYKDRQGRRIY